MSYRKSRRSRHIISISNPLSNNHLKLDINEDALDDIPMQKTSIDNSFIKDILNNYLDVVPSFLTN